MILQKTSDESIFAWEDPNLSLTGLFVKSPDAFAGSGNISPQGFLGLYRRPPVLTNRRLEIEIEIHTPLVFHEGSHHRLYNDQYGSMAVRNQLDEHILLLDCRREWDDDFLMIRLYRALDGSFHGFNCKKLETWNSENAGFMDGGPFMSRKEYIAISDPQLDLLHDFRQLDFLNQFRESCVFLLKLSPSDHGFSLVRAVKLNSSDRSTDGLHPRENLGGWEFGCRSRHHHIIDVAWILLFREVGGESCILKWELNSRIKRPTIQICVPKQSKTPVVLDVEAMEAYFGITTGADRLTECLQHGTSVSGSVKKKLVDGEFVYVTEIKFSPRTDRPETPMTRVASSPSLSKKRKRTP